MTLVDLELDFEDADEGTGGIMRDDDEDSVGNGDEVACGDTNGGNK
jgi:hypothetical protein